MPPEVQVPVEGLYSSVLVFPTPPTTRTRPFASVVAVMCERAVDMLAVAVQLPAAVLADNASGAPAIASSAKRMNEAVFLFTMSPPLLASVNGGQGRWQILTAALNDLRSW